MKGGKKAKKKAKSIFRFLKLDKYICPNPKSRKKFLQKSLLFSLQSIMLCF